MSRTVQHDSARPESQPVVAAIVTSDLGVLIGRRNDGKPPLTFIAGEIEPCESPADAGVREVKEETGLEVTAGREIGRRVHPATGRTMIYMAAEPTSSTAVFVDDRVELAEVRWVSLAEADLLMQPPGMFEPVHDHLTRQIARIATQRRSSRASKQQRSVGESHSSRSLNQVKGRYPRNESTICPLSSVHIVCKPRSR